MNLFNFNFIWHSIYEVEWYFPFLLNVQLNVRLLAHKSISTLYLFHDIIQLWAKLLNCCTISNEWKRSGGSNYNKTIKVRFHYQSRIYILWFPNFVCIEFHIHCTLYSILFIRIRSRCCHKNTKLIENSIIVTQFFMVITEPERLLVRRMSFRRSFIRSRNFPVYVFKKRELKFIRIGYKLLTFCKFKTRKLNSLRVFKAKC